MKARIWLTGFEPFGEHVENPSKILVERILGTSQTHEIKEILPYGLESESVELSFSGRILTVDEAGSSSSLNDLSDVDAVIHVGLNENAEKIRFEMCAINELNFRIADNSGRETKEDFIDENGLPLLHTTVHRPSISHVFSNNEFIEISEDCGRFVCNETYYRTLNFIEKNGLQSRGRALPALFVHIPPFESIPENQQLELLSELCARVVQKPVVQVVGGVLINSNQQILACKRASSQVMSGHWEFPGGKVEADESPSDALKRELNEELGLIVEVGNMIETVVHDYGSMIVEISFFTCQIDDQKLTPTVHDECRWVTESESNSLNWLPADIEFVERLAEKGFEGL